MKKIALSLSALVSLTLASGTVSPALAQTPAATAPGGKLQACFVYIGPANDGGWTYAHDQARRLAEKARPWLSTRYVESVPEGQAMPVLDRLARGGCQVIFTTSFGYMDQTAEAAKKYPNVIFAHAAGYKRAPNLATYMADFYQVYYLNGLIAGALTKSGNVGYVGTFPIPEIKRHINAFALGALAANPKAKVNVKWISAWFDPTKAKQAAEALINQGNDVLGFSEDTPTVVQTAVAHNLPVFGHYNDMFRFGPNNVASGQIVHWDKIYIDFLTKVHNGTYTNKNLQNVDYWWLLNRGAVEAAAQPGVVINPKYAAQLKTAMMTVGGKQVSVYDRVMTLNADMKSARPKFDPFTGPIKDRGGILRVPAGKVASVAELNSMSWVAPGVTGAVADEPKK